MSDPVRFVRYALRTTDADAARVFYAAVLGDVRPEIHVLHESAVARGARPHWLGFLGVDDLDATIAAFEAHGAMRFGPSYAFPDGGRAAVVRDPGGAVVAFATRDVSAKPVPIAWNTLNTASLAKTLDAYREVLGWHFVARRDLGEHWLFDDFTVAHDEPAIGSVGDASTRPGVHPHWLFHFAVDDLDAAVAAARAHGGMVLPVIELTNGQRLAVCDDPQGAAFAMTTRR